MRRLGDVLTYTVRLECGIDILGSDGGHRLAVHSDRVLHYQLQCVLLASMKWEEEGQKYREGPLSIRAVALSELADGGVRFTSCR